MTAEPRYTYHYVPGEEDGMDHLFDNDEWHRRPDEFSGVLAWCEEHFGSHAEMSRWTRNARGCSVWFSNETDAFAFRMRWC